MLSFTNYVQITLSYEVVVSLLVCFQWCHTQGDHLSGKPAKVKNLTAVKEIVRELNKIQGNVRKMS